MLGDDESCEQSCWERVFCEGIGLVSEGIGKLEDWNGYGYLPPHALAYCSTPCLACSSGLFPGIGILAD